jgi:hypothetical protein
VLLVDSRPANGATAAFDDWYDREHLPHLLGLAEIVSSRRYRAEPSIYGEMPAFEHLAVHEIDTDDLSGVFDRIRAGRPTMSPAFERGGPGLAFVQIGEQSSPDPVVTGSDQHLLLVQTQPVEGRDDEFNDWYDNFHLPHVLAVPGFVSVRRFETRPGPDGALATHRYMSLYELRTNDHEATMDGLRAAAVGLRAAKSPAAGPGDIHRSYALVGAMPPLPA